MKLNKGKTSKCTCFDKIDREASGIGQHVVADLWGVKNMINSSKEMEEVLFKAAKAASATPLEVISYEFKPHGVTSVVLLAESHISVHTWPELNHIAIDAFTCGTHTKPKKAVEYLKKIFKPTKTRLLEFKRGIKE